MGGGGGGGKGKGGNELGRARGRRGKTTQKKGKWDGPKPMARALTNCRAPAVASPRKSGRPWSQFVFVSEQKVRNGPIVPRSIWPAVPCNSGEEPLEPAPQVPIPHPSHWAPRAPPKANPVPTAFPTTILSPSQWESSGASNLLENPRPFNAHQLTGPPLPELQWTKGPFSHLFLF